MSFEERKRALRYLMCLKQKSDSSIKARGCADRRPQHEYKTKDKESSPTVSLEAMMLSCAIDAKEGRYLIISDLPRAFLHVDIEDNIHMLALFSLSFDTIVTINLVLHLILLVLPLRCIVDVHISTNLKCGFPCCLIHGSHGSHIFGNIISC